MSELTDCVFLKHGIKMIGDTLYIGNREYPNMPRELQDLVKNEKPKITANSVEVFVNEWQYKDNKWQKTVKGFIKKIL